MKNLTKTIIALLALTICSSASAIDIIKSKKNIVDGINYQLNAKKELAVVVKNAQPYVGDIVIPEKITVDTITYYVEEIDAGAFLNCSGMTSISIPKTVTKIGSPRLSRDAQV